MGRTRAGGVGSGERDKRPVTFSGLLEQAASVGLKPDEFWRMTPVEFFAFAKGFTKALDRKYEIESKLHENLIWYLRLATYRIVQIQATGAIELQEIWPMPGEQDLIRKSDLTRSQAKKIAENYKKAGLIQ